MPHENTKKLLFENLEFLLNKYVIVKLLGNKEFTGVLISYDINLNLVLQNKNNFIYCHCNSIVAICLE